MNCFGCEDELMNIAEEKCPPNNTLLEYFTEIIICEELVIPPQKPNKEHITNTMTNFVVTNAEEIIKNLGDCILRKEVIVDGVLKLGIEYSALVPDQQVHFVHFDIPFRGLIGKRPCNECNRGLLDECFDLDSYKVNVCLEHEQYHQLDHRTIKAVLVILIWLEKA